MVGTIRIQPKIRKMKYLNIGKILCTIMAGIPCLLVAQTETQYTSSTELDTVETVQIAFQRKDKRDVLGGVAAVNVNQLLEKNYFTYSLDNLDAFAPGYHGNIWGNNSLLVFVDGVPRDANNVMPTEIEDITVLKSAAAVALYGSRAAKGAILINTKRGTNGEQRILTRANAGVHAVRRMPNYLGSAEYMSLYNEARRNDGLSDMYSAEAIYNHATGENPYRYPNIDFYSADYMDRSYERYDATMEVTGGNERAKYYTNFGFWREGTLLNFGEAAGNYNHRFNTRGNVDVNIIKNLDAFVDASLSFYNGRGVNANFFSAAATTRPNRFTPLIPVSMLEEDDQISQNYAANSQNLIYGQYLLGGTQLDQSNAIASIYAGGTNTFTSRQFQFTTGVKANLENILEGLTFQTTFGLDYSVSYNLTFNNSYATYQPSWTNYVGSDMIGSLTMYGQDASTRTQSIDNNWFRQTSSIVSQLNYEKQVNDKHNFSSMLVANGFQQAISGEYHKIGSVTLGLNASYNFDQKYYAEFNGALIHSARLPEANRKAFSPTLSLGWRLSKERLFESSKNINDLRLTASAGIIHSDLDISTYYMYENVYKQNGPWYYWNDGNSRIAVLTERGGNPFMEFPKRKEFSLGLDGSLFDNRILFNGSFFISEMTGLLVQRTADFFPSYFSSGWPAASFVPFVNYNADRRQGFDFGVNYRENIGQTNWNFGLTATYYETAASKRAEVWDDNYQYREGRPIDALFGLKHAGFFKDQDDIANSPTQAFGEVRPGDIKYVDQNGDGVINAQDEVFLGRQGWFGSPLTIGLNITANYKNFSLFALGALRTGGIALRNNPYFWVAGEDKYSEIVRGRWTPETAETATFPRLTTLNRNNNFRNSDFWLYSTNRFDLARVQLSYTIPSEKLKNNLHLDKIQAYLNGVNLLTLSPNRDILELNIGSAPQTRFFNIGVRVDF